MDNSIAWAFSQTELNAGEKLVLVWLAWHAGAGVGLMQRDRLAAVTEYEPRSLQRILKSLRDRGLMHESDGWYSLGQTPGNEAPAFPPSDMQPPIELREHLAREMPLITDAEIARIEDVLAKAITDAADGHLVRFNDASLRLLQGIEKIAAAAQVWEHSVADAVAPKDPVLESTHFKAFMAGGMLTHDEAYELASKRLASEAPVDQGPVSPPASHVRSMRNPSAAQVAAAPARKPSDGGGRIYADTMVGRFERVRDILDPDGSQPWAEAMAAWQRLEDVENAHTVKGEMPAFELLYPAIVTGARRHAGKLSIAQFLKVTAINNAGAPVWDDVPAGPSNDAELQVEVNTMLAELERAAHPMCEAPPRTSEGALVEPLLAYYLRVKRVHQQLKRLQEMGV